jgi:RNA polymerase sigma-70 factor (ECF subfamily)
VGARHEPRPRGLLRLVEDHQSQRTTDEDQAATATAARQKRAAADSALIAAVRLGTPGISSTLCDRLWPAVERTIRRLLGRSDPDHEDVAQLAMIEIVNTIERYRGECSLDRWGQTIAAHVVFKHIRRRRLERRLFTGLLVDEPIASPAQTEQRSVSHDLLARIGDHLDGLRPGRAWTFVLHDVLGYDLEEIADMLGTSVAAAQSRLSRGRRELHERISEDPELVDLLDENRGQGDGGQG